MLNMEESRKFCDKRSNCFVKFDCYGNGSSIGAVPVKNCVRNEFVHPSNTCDKSRLDSAQFCHNTDPMLHSFAFTNHCPVSHVPKGYEQARKQECCERKRHQTPEKTVRCYVADFSSIEEYELYIRIHTKGVLTPDRNRKYRHMIKYRLPEKCCAYL
ncbi:Oidioi.mRNA.OKI2018_I69.XSR.g14191.t1.cds [Oikopleura dioica]|uniref:Oidioi.mRNA.OKI2018_I69.XSR.g14191.t1.cds n=1 Tax=Oikopleura dioica TaxID=34765 RepID=A0ABN7SCX5_OIKDI|nr:Oidioi.mRNA.OKI2018_I69.XSR.g14191.t1.cds [Oikopleura dioica]